METLNEKLQEITLKLCEIIEQKINNDMSITDILEILNKIVHIDNNEFNRVMLRSLDKGFTTNSNKSKE